LLGVKVVGDCDVVVFRGSKSFEDWLPDFDVSAIRSFIQKSVRSIRAFSGSIKSFRSISSIANRGAASCWFAGHSLGGRRASNFCALAIVAGVVPAGRVVFGKPRRGFRPLATLIFSIKESRSYRNGNFAGMPR